MRDHRFLVASIVCSIFAVCFFILLMLSSGCSPREWWHLWQGEIIETPGFKIRISNESSDTLDYDDLLAIDDAYAKEMECWWSSQGTDKFVDPTKLVLVFKEPDYNSELGWGGCYKMADYPKHGVYRHNITGTDDVIYTTVCGIKYVLRHEFGHYICWSLKGPFAWECGDQNGTHKDYYIERNSCQPR